MMMKEENKMSDEEYDQKKRELITIQNRDAGWKVIAQICEVLSVFFYSIVVYNA